MFGLLGLICVLECFTSAIECWIGDDDGKCLKRLGDDLRAKLFECQAWIRRAV